MLTKEYSEMLIRLGKEALMSIQSLPTKDREEVEANIHQVIVLLEKNPSPLHWSADYLSYGFKLSRTFEDKQYITILEPVYRFFNELMISIDHDKDTQ